MRELIDMFNKLAEDFGVVKFNGIEYVPFEHAIEYTAHYELLEYAVNCADGYDLEDEEELVKVVTVLYEAMVDDRGAIVEEICSPEAYEDVVLIALKELGLE
jgi:hypothetical protein